MKTFTIRGTVFGEGIPNIAVPVSGRNEKDVLSEIRDAKDCADLMEVRIDAFEGVYDAGRIRRLLGSVRDTYAGPVLFTLRTEREGGGAACTDEQYEEILTAAVESGYIDLLDIEAAFGPVAERLISKAHESDVKTVLSEHDFSATPDADAICAAFVHMEDMGADVAKGAYMPLSGDDVDTLLTAAARARRILGIPFILISMGEKGQMTRTYAEPIGSCLTFAAADGKASAPGQVDAGEIRAILSARHDDLTERKNIYLIGFMGAGKSTVAEVLGRMTGIRVLEMDREIEEEQQKSIPEIFEEFGQPYFRDLETELLQRMEKEPSAIVSCGGGAVLRARNVLLMKSTGRVILLNVSPEEVMRRLAGEVEHRPNLRDRFNPEGIRSLQDLRREAYESAADEVIMTDGKKAEEIAETILSICGIRN